MPDQARKYQLTINHPIESGFSHEEILRILNEQFASLSYYAMADEIGEQGTYHTHVFVVFKSPVRFTTMKNHFPTAHIEIARGSITENVNYIQKSGKWTATAKSETSVKGSFESLGDIPEDNAGSRRDMEELYFMIKQGYSNAEILERNKDMILQIDKLDKIRTTVFQDQYRGQNRLELQVTYVFGETGTGKSRDILERHQPKNVCRVTDYQHPFDHYLCEAVLVFEEFRSNLPLGDMLNYLDIYPITLKARYANKFACFTKVYLVSNWILEKQYEDIQRNDPGSWRAFLRRIHRVEQYRGIGDVVVYDSVEKYLKRDLQFHPVPNQESIPFLH